MTHNDFVPFIINLLRTVYPTCIHHYNLKPKSKVKNGRNPTSWGPKYYQNPVATISSDGEAKIHLEGTNATWGRKKLKILLMEMADNSWDRKYQHGVDGLNGRYQCPRLYTKHLNNTAIWKQFQNISYIEHYIWIYTYFTRTIQK